jgi:hypothetical protein
MFRWWVRYLPYALVVWMAKRRLERFPIPGTNLMSAEPFHQEVICWPRFTP